METLLTLEPISCNSGPWVVLLNGHRLQNYITNQHKVCVYTNISAICRICRHFYPCHSKSWEFAFSTRAKIDMKPGVIFKQCCFPQISSVVMGKIVVSVNSLSFINRSYTFWICPIWKVKCECGEWFFGQNVLIWK